MTSTQASPAGRPGSRRPATAPPTAYAGPSSAGSPDVPTDTLGALGTGTLAAGDGGPPRLPSGRLTLQAPPRLQPSEGAGGLLLNVIPVVGGLGAVIVVATTSRTGGGARSLVAAGLFLLAMVGFVLVQADRQRRQRGRQVGAPRAAYLRYLATVRATVREAAERQRAALTWRHPDPTALPALAEERTRVWDRGPGDEGFLTARWGRGDQALSLELVEPDEPDKAAADDVDPVCATALARLVGVHRRQRDLPASLDLRAFERVEVCGEEEPARALARSLLCSAALATAPDHLLVAVLADPAHLPDWDWVKWLPHAASPVRRDAVGPRRMVATTPEELAVLLPPDLADRAEGALPHVVLVTDGVAPAPGNHVVPPDGVHGVTVLDLPARWGEVEDGPRLRLELQPEPDARTPPTSVPVVALRGRAEPVHGRADQCDLATAEAMARRLAPLRRPRRTAGPGDGTGTPGSADLLDLLGLGAVEDYDAGAAWRTRPARDHLRVPLGLAEDGGPVHLDLKESAQQGMGPHGLVIGATGSGKSELLRTLVLGLALTHPPDRLNMVLVDFKGGATFAGMARMPHVSAVITNLADELGLVDRMADALSGEMLRRQELLRDAGNLASVRDYERARAAAPPESPLPPLPSLFVVVDEFSELLSARPELVDLFVAIGRLGRSLGLHLLLASQRLEEGRLRGLESHLSYRVGLRTFSAQESRAVLGAPDAYELPAEPGLGYLRPDPTTLTRFRAAYVSGPAALERPAPVRDEGGHLRDIWPFTVSEVRLHAPPTPAPGAVAPPGPDHSDAPAGPAGPTLLDLAIDRLEGRGTPAHRVWLPPLDRPDTLDSLMPDLGHDAGLGLVSPGWRARGGLVVPVGAVDRPREQRRDTLVVDLSGAGGHVAVVGGPRSGKSTLLRTLVTSLALVSTPVETQVFVLDFGGGTFTPLDALPHVAGLATRSEPDVVRRIVAEVQGVVERREAHFRAEGIDSMETYRRRRAAEAGRSDAGRVDDGWGDVLLVVDGWSTLRTDFEDLEQRLQQLAARGLTYGLHLVVGAARWADLRAATRDLLGTRIELRLGDPLDSEVDRRLAAAVPTGRPGRGLAPDQHHVLAALPRIDGRDDAASLGEGVDDLVARVAAAWPGPRGPRLRLLPHHLELDDVRRQAGVSLAPAAPDAEPTGERLLLGVDESRLAPVGLDPGTEPLLLVLGDGGSGKSAVLRTHLREVVRTRSARHAQVVLLDYRRSLLGEVPEDHLLDYLTSTTQATPVLADLARYLESRLPGPDVTPEQLRSRSWWRGAEVFVVVDDYDLVATGATSPVSPLVPLLPQARDVGLHLVVARRSGGASRALYDPVIQTLRDLAAPGLMLSGNPDEGPLLGGLRPTPLPPGRGRLLTRERGVEVVQTTWTDPAL